MKTKGDKKQKLSIHAVVKRPPPISLSLLLQFFLAHTHTAAHCLFPVATVFGEGEAVVPKGEREDAKDVKGRGGDGETTVVVVVVVTEKRFSRWRQRLAPFAAARRFCQSHHRCRRCCRRLPNAGGTTAWLFDGGGVQVSPSSTPGVSAATPS